MSFAARNDPLQQFSPEGGAPERAEVPELFLNEDVRDEPARAPGKVEPSAPPMAAEPDQTAAAPRNWAAVLGAVRLSPVHVAVVYFVCGGAIGALAVWLIALQPGQHAAITDASVGQRLVTAEALAPVSGAAAASDISLPPEAAAPPENTRAAGPGTPAPVPAGGSPGRERPARPSVAAARASARDAAVRGSTAAESTAGFRGSLLVNSEPPGARVFVGGEPVGSTPLELKALPIGSRAVRIEAAGYQNWSAAVQVVANRRTQVTATLTR